MITAQPMTKVIIVEDPRLAACNTTKTYRQLETMAGVCKQAAAITVLIRGFPAWVAGTAQAKSGAPALRDRLRQKPNSPAGIRRSQGS